MTWPSSGFATRSYRQVCTRQSSATPIAESPSTRRVAVVGGNRIPFARSNSAYAHASNQDMLTAALDGLAARFGLQGDGSARWRPAPCSSTAATSTSPARRCSAAGSRRRRPAYDLQQACDTGIQAAIAVANKIALGAIEVGIAGGTDTTSDAPIAVNERLRKILLEANRAEVPPGSAGRAGQGPSGPPGALHPGRTASRAPGCRWASLRP